MTPCQLEDGHFCPACEKQLEEEEQSVSVLTEQLARVTAERGIAVAELSKVRGELSEVWKSRDRVEAELAQVTKERDELKAVPRCDNCGSHKMIVSPPGCPMCGAPQCCTVCCELSRTQAERDAALARAEKAENHGATCEQCKWTNTGCLKIQGRWMCHGCLDRMAAELGIALARAERAEALLESVKDEVRQDANFGRIVESLWDEPLNAAQAELSTLRAQLEEARKDSELLDHIQAEFWTVRANASPNADAGDYTTWWEVLEHHRAKPNDRVIGTAPENQLRKALRAAIDAAKGAASE